MVHDVLALARGCSRHRYCQRILERLGPPGGEVMTTGMAYHDLLPVSAQWLAGLNWLSWYIFRRVEA